MGTSWAIPQLKTFVPKLRNSPTDKYDLVFHWTDKTTKKRHNIKIEVKASRAADIRKIIPTLTFPERVLRLLAPYPFDMNFQQLKPRCCDVFIWIGIWRDAIQYWVISSNELTSLSDYSEKQHRGNKGEGQCHIKKRNIDKFKNFLVAPEQLEQEIISSYKKQYNNTK